MDATQLLLIVVSMWAVIGTTTAVVMGRRGHRAFMWLLLGSILGPLSIPLVVRAIADERRTPSTQPSPGRPGTGGIDVLVGIDGSVRSSEALRTAVELFGPSLGRLTLAGVVDFESAHASAPWDDRARAASDLDRLAASIDGVEPGAVILVGAPAAALMHHAVEDAYDVLVVGRRGHGASQAFLGSTSSRLAEGSGLPLLIV